MKGRQMYTIPRQGSGESGSGYSVRSDDLRSVESFYHTVSITLHCLIGIRTSTFDINVNIYLLLHLYLFFIVLLQQRTGSQSIFDINLQGHSMISKHPAIMFKMMKFYLNTVS